MDTEKGHKKEKGKKKLSLSARRPDELLQSETVLCPILI